MIVPVILSGGTGTQLWPLSTAEAPKQFQPLIGDGDRFRRALARVVDHARFAPLLIVCDPAHVAHVETDLAATGIVEATIIVEPRRATPLRQSRSRRSPAIPKRRCS